MKKLDRWLQLWRVSKALRHVPLGASVLDIGCLDGALFTLGASKIRSGVGIDPLVNAEESVSTVLLIRGVFPCDLPQGLSFSVVTALAVLEHIDHSGLPAFVEGCNRCLDQGGLLILTVPSPYVDLIIQLLKSIRVLDGMSVERHHGFDPRDIPGLFEAPRFNLIHQEKFQIGLNNLFVFRKGSSD